MALSQTDEAEAQTVKSYANIPGELTAHSLPIRLFSRQT
jgi:hypothetical protein